MIQWIPSHVGIDGNEEADDYAIWRRQISALKITYSDAQWEIKNRMIKSWQLDYQQLSLWRGTFHYNVLSRVSIEPWFHGHKFNGIAIKIITRLRTSHGLCGLKKFMFKNEQSPMCETCQKLNDLEHIAYVCMYHQTSQDK